MCGFLTLGSPHINAYAMMSTHMRTTVDIPDALLQRARARANERGVTLKELVSESLRSMLADYEGTARAKPFVLPTYGRGGLRGGVSEAELFNREEREPGPGA